jgi:LPXTG-site transpeptidase (sortase) family protein
VAATAPAVILLSGRQSMKLRIDKKLALFTSTVLVVLGVAGCTPTLYYHFTSNGSVAAHGLPAAKPANSGDRKVSGHPKTISIPSLKVNLPVIDGYYNQSNKQWTLTLNKAQFATIAPEPNNIAGNTFIYGHYRREVFSSLHNIKPGAKVAITTDNGYKFSYRFSQTYATSPEDSSIFSYKGAPILTIQTCSGTWFQNRQMYLFDYVGYKKI